MYQLHFDALDTIIKNIIKKSHESLNDINEFIINEYNDYLTLEPKVFTDTNNGNKEDMKFDEL